MSQYKPIKMDEMEMMNSLRRTLNDAAEIITDLECTDNIPKEKRGFFRVLKASVEYGADEVKKCMRENAPTESDEIVAELEELEKTEPFAYGDTKIRMGVGLGIMKARKIVDNYREEGL